MNRRLFLKLLAGMGVAASGIFGLKRCSMNQTVSYLINDNLPSAIKIDEMGWRAFLQKWNDDLLVLVRQYVLYNQTNYDWVKFFLKENNDESLKDLLSQRFFFPPRNVAEEEKANQVLKYILSAIIYEKKNRTEEIQVVSGNDCIDEMLINDGLLFPSANQAMIDEFEQKVLLTLPESYKEFLLISNGMLSFFGRLLPVNEIDWLRIRDKEVMEAWWIEGSEPPWTIPDSEYLDYEANGVFGAPDQTFRMEYLEHCLEIGDNNQDWDSGAFWLLNPVIQTSLNDWEAWIWTPSDPSVPRYRNFKAMMENRYRFEVAQMRIELLYLEEELNQKT